MTEQRETWSGRGGFILATVGSAVGLGSIWKFPYEVGANGGTAFVFFYIAGLMFIVVPLMFAEFAIGRRGRGDASASIEAVAAEHNRGRLWALAGILGVVTGFLILSFYSVIGGWTIAYAVDTALNGLGAPDAAAAQARYDALLASPARLIFYHGLFMLASGAVVMRGVGGGIEMASKLLMPVLVLLMGILLAVYAMIEGDLAATVRFLFQFDFAHFTARAAIEALGLGFFSIGVGLSLMITYAAYAPPGDRASRRWRSSSAVADTAISFLAGFAVFPIVFSHGLDPASGAGLVFVTLPIAFADMPFGDVAAVAFFVLLFVAALASAISMLELVVATLRRASAGRGVRARALSRPSPASPPDWQRLLVQYLVRLASARGLSQLRAGDGLRSAGRVDIERPAAVGRLRPGDLRRLGPAAANPRQGTLLVPHRRSLAAPPAALCRTRRDCSCGPGPAAFLDTESHDGGG